MRMALNEGRSVATSRTKIDLGLQGMNGRFDHLEMSFDRKLDLQGESIKKSVEKTVREEMQRQKEQIQKRIAETLTAAANEIRVRPTAQREIMREQQVTVTEKRPGFGHLLCKGYCPSDSMMDVYREWHGLREFDGIPVAGGIAKMEDIHKARWRKAYTSAQQKHLSRISMIMKAVERRKDDGEALKDIIADLTQMFSRRDGTNLKGTVAYCQEQGWVSKRKRTSNTSNSNAQLSP
jgi:hypothetical protein